MNDDTKKIEKLDHLIGQKWLTCLAVRALNALKCGISSFSIQSCSRAVNLWKRFIVNEGMNVEPCIFHTCWLSFCYYQRWQARWCAINRWTTANTGSLSARRAGGRPTASSGEVRIVTLGIQCLSYEDLLSVPDFINMTGGTKPVLLQTIRYKDACPNVFFTDGKKRILIAEAAYTTRNQKMRNTEEWSKSMRYINVISLNCLKKTQVKRSLKF